MLCSVVRAAFECVAVSGTKKTLTTCSTPQTQRNQNNLRFANRKQTVLRVKQYLSILQSNSKMIFFWSDSFSPSVRSRFKPWEALRAAHSSPSPARLCSACPELPSAASFPNYTLNTAALGQVCDNYWAVQQKRTCFCDLAWALVVPIPHSRTTVLRGTSPRCALYNPRPQGSPQPHGNNCFHKQSLILRIYLSILSPCFISVSYMKKSSFSSFLPLVLALI